MRSLKTALVQRVLLTDGSLLRQLRQTEFDVDRDLFGHPERLELLNLTRVRVVREAHEAFLRAGADIIRTNALGANPLALKTQELGEQAFAINYSAAQVACEAVDAVPGRGRRRFVMGVVRDFGWDVAPKTLEQAISIQVEGLLAGGADGVALDLMPGVGRAPAFLRGAISARERLKGEQPIYLETGPEAGERRFSPLAASRADGVLRFAPGRLARHEWLQSAIRDEVVNLLGGGDDPDDTQEMDRFLRAESEDGLRPYLLKARGPDEDEVVPASSCLYVDPAMAEVR